MKAYRRGVSLYNLYDEQGRLTEFVDLRFKIVKKYSEYYEKHTLENHKLNSASMKEVSLNTYYKVRAMITSL